MIRRAIASLAALGISMAALAQPCHPGLRLFETDHAAYEAQARRVFAAHGIPYAEHRLYELDHRVPRCLAVGDYDSDDNLWPQRRAEALIKDDMEAEVCRLVCNSEQCLLSTPSSCLRIGEPATASCSDMRHERNGLVDADLITPPAPSPRPVRPFGPVPTHPWNRSAHDSSGNAVRNHRDKNTKIEADGCRRR
jgi:hypothetical protein